MIVLCYSGTATAPCKHGKAHPHAVT